MNLKKQMMNLLGNLNIASCDPYDSDIEVEMPREALEILRKMLGLDSTKTHDEHIGDLDTRRMR